MFDARRQDQINSEDECESLIQDMVEIIDGYDIAIKNVVRQMGERLDAYQPKDTNALNEEMKSLQGRINHLVQEVTRLQNEIAEKKRLEQNLSEKYSCERDEIETRINEQMQSLDSQWASDAEIRNVWANTLDKFASLLKNPQTAKYDEQYYLDIYLKSCNVVGITCTANLRFAGR